MKGQKMDKLTEMLNGFADKMFQNANADEMFAGEIKIGKLTFQMLHKLTRIFSRYHIKNDEKISIDPNHDYVLDFKTNMMNGTWGLK